MSAKSTSTTGWGRELTLPCRAKAEAQDCGFPRSVEREVEWSEGRKRKSGSPVHTPWSTTEGKKDPQAMSKQGLCTHTLEPPLIEKKEGERRGGYQRHKCKNTTKTRVEGMDQRCPRRFDEITAPEPTTATTTKTENGERR